MRKRLVRSRWMRAATVLAMLSTAWFATGATAQDRGTNDLRRAVLARFDVMPLRAGVALVGRTRDRRVEVVDGLVLAGGTPLAGAELRDRLGADAAIVLKLSYLTNEQLKDMFAPAPPARAPSPPPPSAPPSSPAPVSPVRSGQPPATADGTTPESSRTYRRTGARLALGKSVTVDEDEDVTEGVVAVLGNVTVAGRVRDEIVAIGGSVTLTPSAEVRGDITAVGGAVTIAPGARHSGSVHNAVFKEWQGWSWPHFGWARGDMDRATKWLTLAGTVTRVLLLGLAVGAIGLVARTRVGRVGAAVAASPVRAAVVGLGTQILFVPALVVVAIALAVTIVGLPFLAIVIPVALLAMLAAMLLGIASLAQALGSWVTTRLGWRTDATLLTAAIGLGLVVLPTLLARLVGVGPNAVSAPAVALLVAGTVVEYAAWTVGLGAAVMTGLGRWSTVPPPLPGPYASAPSSL